MNEALNGLLTKKSAGKGIIHRCVLIFKLKEIMKCFVIALLSLFTSCTGLSVFQNQVEEKGS